MLTQEQRDALETVATYVKYILRKHNERAGDTGAEAEAHRAKYMELYRVAKLDWKKELMTQGISPMPKDPDAEIPEDLAEATRILAEA